MPGQAGVVAPHRGADEPLRVDVALFDLEQKPVRGRVRVDLFERKVYSHRKRLVGGFYAYEHTAETVALGPLCEGRTDRHGRRQFRHSGEGFGHDHGECGTDSDERQAGAIACNQARNSLGDLHVRLDRIVHTTELSTRPVS